MWKVTLKYFTLILLLILVTSEFLQPGAQDSEKGQSYKITETLNSLRSYFIENKGQLKNRAKFYLALPYGNAYFDNGEIMYELFHNTQDGKSSRVMKIQPGKEIIEEVKVWNICMQFLGANPRVKIHGLEQSESAFSYFLGPSPRHWVEKARAYHRVIYTELYPNVDLLVFRSQGGIKYEYRVRAGGDPGEIRWCYGENNRIKILENGALEIESTQGTLQEEIPLSYQTIDGKRIDVKTEYLIDDNNIVRFALGHYAKDRELIIDPELVYSTYLGGSKYEYGYATSVDSDGNVYVTGKTYSGDFPTTSKAFDTTHNGQGDVFITKLNADGTGIVYSTYIGGAGGDAAKAIAVDKNGNVHITGSTHSKDFPTTPGALDTTYNGNGDVFITKLNADGSQILYSTYLGGSNYDIGWDITLDEMGNTYFTGDTMSKDFPASSNAYTISFGGYSDAFVSKLDSQGKVLLYSTYLGGNGFDGAFAIEVRKHQDRQEEDRNDNQNGRYIAYITGNTQSRDFPTTSDAYDQTHNGKQDIFVTIVDHSGIGLGFSTFLGGSEDDYAYSLVLDSVGSVYVTGQTESKDFPTTEGAYDEGYNGKGDAFITKINPTGSDLGYSTFLGGSHSLDVGRGIKTDKTGNVFITGYTLSKDFPTHSDAYDSSHNGSEDAFVAELNSTGKSLVYSSFLGGADRDYAFGVQTDKNFNLYITGLTWSSDFPTTLDAFNSTYNGGYDVFVFKLRRRRKNFSLQSHTIFRI